MEGLTRDSAMHIMPKEVSTITLGVIHWDKVINHLACLAFEGESGGRGRKWFGLLGKTQLTLGKQLQMIVPHCLLLNLSVIPCGDMSLSTALWGHRCQPI